jgi:transcriptional regulator with XRE-family HTH domain
MPRKSRLKLPVLMLGKETLGQRISRLRKERGYSQTELAEKIGIIQVLVSDYERDKLRHHPDMVIRFAKALDVSADELLGLEKPKHANGFLKNRRLLRRLQQIDHLPKRDQQALLRMIDNTLRSASQHAQHAF